MAIRDLTGKHFGRWEVVRFTGSNKNQKSMWLCRCSCGAEKEVVGNNLSTGISNSCGCLEKELKTKHGMWRTAEYRAWQDMKDRCNNPNNKYYKDYGGRGIKVCSFWENSFESFYADMGKRIDNSYSLDRINVNLGYSPDNCRWAKNTTQQRNKRNSHLIETPRGLITLAEASQKSGINKSTLRSRLVSGIPQEQLFKKD